jgi:hypothetical protein
MAVQPLSSALTSAADCFLLEGFFLERSGLTHLLHSRRLPQLPILSRRQLKCLLNLKLLHL